MANVSKTVLYELAESEKVGREREWIEREYLWITEAGKVMTALRFVGPGKRDFLVVDGRRSLDVTELLSFCYSTRHPRWAAAAKVEKKVGQVLRDGELFGPTFNDVFAVNLSDDGERLAYIARSGRTAHHVVIEGEASDAYSYVAELQFRPGCHDTSYMINEGGKPDRYGGCGGGLWFVCADRVKGEVGYAQVSAITFSPDGEQLAYIVNEGGQRDSVYDATGGRWWVIRDGEKTGPANGYDHVNQVVGLTFSASGRLAHMARLNDGEVYVLDGQISPVYSDVSRIMFSPDGSRFAYSVDRNSFVIDGERLEQFESVGQLLFSDDSAHYAYIADEGEKRWVIHDGQRGPEFSTRLSSSIELSPNGERIYYIGNDGENACVYLDGEKLGAEYSNIGFAAGFSPNGERFAYDVYTGEGKRPHLWLVDGAAQELASFEHGGFAWSGDSAHFAHVGAQAKNKWFIAIDGEVATDLYTRITHLTYNPHTNAFVALAMSKKQALLIEIVL